MLNQIWIQTKWFVCTKKRKKKLSIDSTHTDTRKSSNQFLNSLSTNNKIFAGPPSFYTKIQVAQIWGDEGLLWSIKISSDALFQFWLSGGTANTVQHISNFRRPILSLILSCGRYEASKKWNSRKWICFPKFQHFNQILLKRSALLQTRWYLSPMFCAAANSKRRQLTALSRIVNNHYVGTPSFISS